MDLKINREMLPVTEILLDEVQEQSVELDYVLPDYDPDIFRIMAVRSSRPLSIPLPEPTASPTNCVQTFACCTVVRRARCCNAWHSR